MQKRHQKQRPREKIFSKKALKEKVKKTVKKGTASKKGRPDYPSKLIRNYSFYKSEIMEHANVRLFCSNYL